MRQEAIPHVANRSIRRRTSPTYAGSTGRSRQACRRSAVARREKPVLAADGAGSGHVYNRLLIDRLRHRCVFHAILYSTSEHEPFQEGLLLRWTVNRSASIGLVFARVKKKTLLFPRVTDCGSYLDELAGEVAEYDDYQRGIRYTHPESQPDDALHAVNYALLVGIRAHAARLRYGA